MSSQKASRKGASKRLIAAVILATVAAVVLAPKIKKALPKNVQKRIKSLAKEISKRAASAGGLTKAKYEKIVDMAARSYAKGKRISEEEVEIIVPEIKKHWNRIKNKIK